MELLLQHARQSVEAAHVNKEGRLPGSKAGNTHRKGVVQRCTRRHKRHTWQHNHHSQKDTNSIKLKHKDHMQKSCIHTSYTDTRPYAFTLKRKHRMHESCIQISNTLRFGGYHAGAPCRSYLQCQVRGSRCSRTPAPSLPTSAHSVLVLAVRETMYLQSQTRTKPQTPNSTPW